MPTVWVRLGLGRDYPIHIRPHALGELGRWTRQRVKGRTACVLTHPRILRLHGRMALASLRQAGFRVVVLTVPEGETSKSLKEAERIMGRMIQAGMDRKTVVVGFGGGVIGDLAGFVAAVYLRGVEFVQVPTTLLAQVDSSVGGKVAVNHALGKNLIGAFLQPRLVVTDPEVLRTLPERQFRAGMAEVIKSAIIADAGFFQGLEQAMKKIRSRDARALSYAIAQSCRIKARVVEKDEREQNLRAILNYGHTVGHALETYHHYQGYLHGEAVAIGMMAAARMAQDIGLCTVETVRRQERLLALAGLPVRGKGENTAKILKHMKVDKKVVAGEFNFVLTPQIGRARISQKIPPFSVHRVLQTVLGNT